MIRIQNFHEHIQKHPRIADAFEYFQTAEKGYYEKEENGTERYKNALSNFIHGAFRSTENPETITTCGNLLLRTANIEDYQFINEAERDEDCKSWVNNWHLCTRIEKFGDNNFLQTIIETNNRRIGFIDFRDMLHNTQVELKRIVITERGKGYGKEAMYLSQKFAFEILNRNRLHLGTKVENLRAQHLYHATGFKLVNPEHIAYFHMLKEDYAND
ncbi:MAG: GNAT family N-acetyltransferase [Defluviitaleaceae bacterium]|nr:GNAT family N-acetyltransferase [Defluviitaleaceae bacterium]